MEAALRDLVVRMRASGAGVFDASTAVSRPVQRCVKYPLFLSEIAKYTPISHPDHPKLLEAVKQLSNLGSKMNESKRRKELKFLTDLARKYSEEQSNNSFGDMLSKLTMHSIKKKSNRFTYRMGSSLGVVKLTTYSEESYDAMKTVDELDSALIARIRTRFQEEISAYHSDPLANTSHLIVPGMSCFANYYDPDRLKPLHNIVNKASKFVRLNSRSSSPLKAKDSVAKCEHKEVEGLSDAPSDGKFSTEGYKLNEKKAFRAQTIDERKQILIKADLKFVYAIHILRTFSLCFTYRNRRADIYRCKSNWPASLDALEQNKILGKMLIVNEGDAVLAVRKDPCNMWLCYNGYYNAVLPSTILTPWYSSSNGVNKCLYECNSTVFYEEPPPDTHERAVDQYDNPPVEIQPLRMVPVPPGDRLPNHLTVSSTHAVEIPL
uniref:DH domain-containing protein n=1 Tax=Heterorhabditis bacteriophora TaxID=37862 RepID=A0A1I7X841_HETBA